MLPPSFDLSAGAYFWIGLAVALGLVALGFWLVRRFRRTTYLEGDKRALEHQSFRRDQDLSNREPTLGRRGGGNVPRSTDRALIGLAAACVETEKAMNDQRGWEPAVVGVFEHKADAQTATRYLLADGFSKSRIGVIVRDLSGAPTSESTAAGGAAAGAATGAGIAGLWALGIASGMLPAIGPVVAGGIFGSLAASAATGAVAGGVVGALLGLGLPAEEAERYNSQFEAGKTLVTVQDGGMRAADILRACGGDVRNDWPYRKENREIESAE